ncbi:hypothetical protein HYD47_03750 [Mycoplasmopsis bovis]|nr:hypothetical protein [Mycoplasmopsis bovis]QQH78072.1 hypothetical protein HYD47_03750 [Mycoplasmopsis bovis]
MEIKTLEENIETLKVQINKNPGGDKNPGKQTKNRGGWKKTWKETRNLKKIKRLSENKNTWGK